MAVEYGQASRDLPVSPSTNRRTNIRFISFMGFGYGRFNPRNGESIGGEASLCMPTYYKYLKLFLKLWICSMYAKHKKALIVHEKKRFTKGMW